jgi:hypothetical protein
LLFDADRVDHQPAINRRHNALHSHLPIPDDDVDDISDVGLGIVDIASNSAAFARFEFLLPIPAGTLLPSSSRAQRMLLARAR